MICVDLFRYNTKLLLILSSIWAFIRISSLSMSFSMDCRAKLTKFLLSSFTLINDLLEHSLSAYDAFFLILFSFTCWGNNSFFNWNTDDWAMASAAIGRGSVFGSLKINFECIHITFDSLISYKLLNSFIWFNISSRGSLLSKCRSTSWIFWNWDNFPLRGLFLDKILFMSIFLTICFVLMNWC